MYQLPTSGMSIIFENYCNITKRIVILPRKNQAQGEVSVILSYKQPKMKKSNLNTITGRFRQVRIDKRLTQEEFANELSAVMVDSDHIKLTRMGVNAIEIGRYEPKLDLVRAIHKRFGTPYSWLLDGDSKDMDIDKIKGEVESLRKIVLDQKELIETQKKLIAAMEKK